jgi:uncharacterized membrane protein YkoI
MVNTKILVSIVIVLLIGVAAASYQMTTNSPGLWQPTTSQKQTSDQNSNTQSEQTQSGTQDGTSGESQGGDGGNNVKISSDQAKSIAQQSIEEPGATAGTPQLKTMNGEKVYVVPVIKDNEKVGEIWVDPETGENIGGAGGAP